MRGGGRVLAGSSWGLRRIIAVSNQERDTRDAENPYRKDSALFDSPFFSKRGGVAKSVYLFDPYYTAWSTLSRGLWAWRRKAGGRGVSMGRRIADHIVIFARDRANPTSLDAAPASLAPGRRIAE